MMPNIDQNVVKQIHPLFNSRKTLRAIIDERIDIRYAQIIFAWIYLSRKRGDSPGIILKNADGSGFEIEVKAALDILIKDQIHKVF